MVNPDTQAVFAADERKTIMGEYSTLAMLDQAFGCGAAASWIVTLITNLNIFAGSRSMDDHQVRNLALLLSQEYRNMKYSVMQLFFHRFKCGDFGRFYGKVDPLVITCSLKEFVTSCEHKRQQYMNEEYVAKQQEKARRKEEQEKRWEACRQELVTEAGRRNSDEHSPTSHSAALTRREVCCCYIQPKMNTHVLRDSISCFSQRYLPGSTLK